jgi:hypothetical protein
MSGNQYNYTRVWEIFELLHPKPDDLISPERFFVREGEMTMWDEKKKKKKKRYFFLFNDVLLLCRRETHKRYWLRIHITLRSPHVSVEDIDNSSFNNEFRVHCRARTFILYAGTPDQKKEWITDLRHSIAGTHPDEKKKDGKHDDKDDKKEEVRKTKKEPKKEKPPESESEESSERTPRKKAETGGRRSKTRKTSKPPKQEAMPFDPFGPTGGQMAGNPFGQNMNMKPVGNPFLPMGNPQMQPNIISTAPIAGASNFGFNQGMQPNAMGYNQNMNQGFNNGFNANANLGYNPNVNPQLNANMGFNNQAGFNANANLGYNPNVNPALNANMGYNNPAANPFAQNNQPVTTGTNPFAAPVQRQQTGGNTNPFLNNNGPFSNQQNPLF